jgi:hypothetical protein
VTAAVLAAPAGPEDDGDEVVATHEACACGASAAVVLIDDGESVWAGVRCQCGSFRPAAAYELPSAPVGDEEGHSAARRPTRGDRP